MELAQSGASGMVITDSPVKTPGLGACAACVAGECRRAVKYLERVHIDIDGLTPAASAGGREYVCVVADDYTRAVNTRPLRLKSEAVEGFKASRAAAENEPGKRVREIMMGNTHELSIAAYHAPIRLCIKWSSRTSDWGTHQCRAHWPWSDPSWVS